MEPSALLDTLAEKTRNGFQVTHPETGRKVAIGEKDFSRILELVPAGVMETFRKAPGGDARKDMTLAVLAARLNLRLTLRWVEKEGAVTLPVEKLDPPMGYYYPEKGKAACFKAHGRILVEPHALAPIPDPEGDVLEKLEADRISFAGDPFTVFAAVRHGAFTCLVQAKRLNGRKYLFARLLHDGRRTVAMTHWARVTGADAGTLIKRCGIDPKGLTKPAS